MLIKFLLVVLLAAGGTPKPISPHDTLAECQARVAELKAQYADQIEADGVTLVCYEAK